MAGGPAAIFPGKSAFQRHIGETRHHDCSVITARRYSGARSISIDTSCAIPNPDLSNARLAAGLFLEGMLSFSASATPAAPIDPLCTRDTLKRHVSTHGPEALQSYTSWSSAASHRTRACRQCARVKKRCIGNTPCTRCLKKALPCEPNREVADEIPSGLRSTTDGDGLLTESIETEQSSVALQTPDASASSLVSAHSTAIGIDHAEGTTTSDVPNLTIPDADIVNLMNTPQLDFLNPQYMGSPTFSFPYFFIPSPQPLTSLLSEDFDTSQALSGFVNDNSALGPAMEETQLHVFDEPTRLHHPGNDSEDEDDIDAVAAEDFGHPCKLSTENYQRVRRFLREQTKPCQDSSRLCQGLPSISAMNAFLQLYFEHFAPQLPFIHAPTFEPDNATELLLIAVANIGCHHSRSRHRLLYRSLFMQALGDSIQQQFPHDPAKSNLELLQCVLLYHMSLMCGGHLSEVLKLQFERNILATLFRYSKRHANRNSQQCSTATAAASIQGTWRSWVHVETEKRVLYSVWVLECCNKFFFEDHPLLSLSELNIALPSKDELWDAPDAQTWHSLYLGGSKRRLSLSALFLGPRPTSDPFEGLGSFSRTIAMMAFSIEEQRILDSSRCWIFPVSPSTNGQSYRTQLVRDRDSDLSLFGFDAPFQPPENSHDASGRRYFHLISILRDVSLRHLYASCGWKSTDAEVDAASDAISAWMNSNNESARKCVMHAGALFGDVRSQTYKMSFDALFLLISILYLWAFQRFSPDDNSGLDTKPVLRIDSGVDETVADSWIQGKSDYTIHITGVGRLTGRDSAVRLLKELRRVLVSSTSWTTFHVGVAKGVEKMIKGEKALEPDV